VTSFSIIVSCICISLLLVTVGIMCSRAGGSINLIINILFDGENISFGANLVTATEIKIRAYGPMRNLILIS
jgi:hypothetical protein